MTTRAAPAVRAAAVAAWISDSVGLWSREMVWTVCRMVVMVPNRRSKADAT